MQKPINDSGDICPFHQKDVRKVCHKCPLYVSLRGTNPNTGEEVDQWGCSLAFMPMLTIENSQQQRQTGAAVESFRNEMVRSQAAIGGLMLEAAKAANKSDPKLIEG
jgi:hypothetical protein